MPEITKKTHERYQTKVIRGKEYYPVKLCGLKRNLPLFEVAPGVKIAIFNLLGDVNVVKKTAKALTEKLPKRAQVIVTAEVKSIPLAYEMAKILELPYVVLRKIIKPYMGRTLKSETLSITTGKKQQIWLDEKDLCLLKGKKVVIVDDVISTGSTLKGMEDVVRKAGGKIIAKAAIFTEGKKRADVISLFYLPIFKV